MSETSLPVRAQVEICNNKGLHARASAKFVKLASSFEGAYLVWRQLSRGRSIDAFRFTNVDAITRWYWQLPGVDGLHRAMWWTQQHETALTLALIVLLVHVRARRPDSVGAGIVEGLMLGGALAFSSFNGLLLVSSILNFQTARFTVGNDLPYVLFLPTYAATAWHHKRLTPDLQRNVELYAGCVAGAALQDHYLAMLREAGFEQVEVLSEGAYTVGSEGFPPGSPERDAFDAVRSVKVRAVKPAAACCGPDCC